AHEIQVRAPGKKTWSQTVNLGPGAVTTRVEVPNLEDESAAKTAPASTTSTVRDVPMTADHGAVGGDASGRRLAGYALGGAGIAGVGVAVVLGVRAMLFNNKSQDETAKANADTLPEHQQTLIQAARSDHSAASANQIGAIVAGVVGAGALGAGAYFL